MPALHASAPHGVPERGKVHDVVVTPSHDGPQLVPMPVPVHAARAPCGTPFTGQHLPTFPGTSHALHSLAHVLSQHTPSTQ
jgi:hypothetical protein